MLGFDTLLRRLNRINKNHYHKSRELIGSYQGQWFTLHVDSAPKDPFLPPGRMRIKVPFKFFGYPEEFKKEPLSLLLAHFFSMLLSELNSKHIKIYRPTNIIIRRTNCIVGRSIEFRIDYHLPSRSRHILSEEAKNVIGGLLDRIKSLRFREIRKSEYKSVFEEMRKTYEDQLALRKRMREEGIAAFIANGSVIPRLKFTRRPMPNAVPFKVPDEWKTVLEGRHRTFEGLAIYKNRTTLITGSNFQGKSTLLSGIATGFYNHVAGDGREFVLSEEMPLGNKESGRIVNFSDLSLFLQGGERVNTLNASGSVSQMANISDILRMKMPGMLVDEDESAVNFLVKPGISYVKERKVRPFSEVSRGLGMTQIIAAGALKEMEEIADDVIVLENYNPVKVVRRDASRTGIPPIKDYPITKVSRFSVEEATKDRIVFRNAEIPLTGPIRVTIYERAQVYLLADLLKYVEPGMGIRDNVNRIWEMLNSSFADLDKSKNYSMITKYQLFYVVSRLPFLK